MGNLQMCLLNLAREGGVVSPARSSQLPHRSSIRSKVKVCKLFFLISDKKEAA